MLVPATVPHMSAVEILNQIRAMPLAERQTVVGRIWAEFAETDLALTSAQTTELDRRLQEHVADPTDVLAWREIKSANETKYGRVR